MRFEQTQDLFDHIDAYHHQASQLYRQLMAGASNQWVQMLLNYLARHEQMLEGSIAEFKVQSPPQVLKSWF